MENVFSENLIVPSNNAIYWGNRFEFQKAFLAAQIEFEPLLKDANNPHFKSKYAALINVLAVASKPCLDHGITITQATTIKDNNLLIDTELTYVGATADSLGGVIYKHAFPIPANLTAQQLGSWITYMRRYVLMPIFGIAPEDDDGNAASQKTEPKSKKTTIAANQERANIVYSPTAHKLQTEISALKTIAAVINWWNENIEILVANTHHDSIADYATRHCADLIQGLEDIDLVLADKNFNEEQLKLMPFYEDVLNAYRVRYSELKKAA